MPRDPLATRDRLVDAFAALVVASGARSATLEAVAARAGVSKGGLLYHFASKDALVEGLVQRFERFAREDLELMRVAPEGPAEYYVRTSATEVVSPAGGSEPDPLSTALVAMLRLAQEGDSRAGAAFTAANDGWRELIEVQLGGDRGLARMVQLIGDGLWGSASMGIPVTDLEEILEQVRHLVASSRDHLVASSRDHVVASSRHAAPTA